MPLQGSCVGTVFCILCNIIDDSYNTLPCKFLVSYTILVMYQNDYSQCNPWDWNWKGQCMLNEKIKHTG